MNRREPELSKGGVQIVRLLFEKTSGQKVVSTQNYLEKPEKPEESDVLPEGDE